MNLFLVFLLGLAVTVTAEVQCQTFKEIYGSGKNVCEKLWGDSFKYETNEDKAYTMWWSYGDNPNPAVSQALGHNSTHTADTCHLQYYHKRAPGPEGEHMKECHPWNENACCSNTTIESPDKINKAYGEGYRWDRCGKLSQSCERFMVQEACFYECEPEAGLYRKFNPIAGLGHTPYNASLNTGEWGGHNEWEMHKMPIKASYCDAWYLACKDDKFCTPGDGSDAGFFSCKKAWDAEEQNTTTIVKVVETKEGKEKKEWLFIGVICLVVVFCLILCVCVLVQKEKSGEPMFAPLTDKANSNAN